jgi:hypothetical protein
MKTKLGILTVVVLFAAFYVRIAQADAIGTGKMKITITSYVNEGGPQYLGDIFSASFTYNATQVANDGYAPILSFTTDFPSWVGGSMSEVQYPWYFASIPGYPWSGPNFWYLPPPYGDLADPFGGNPNAFGFSPDGVFFYGRSFEEGSLISYGEGTYTFETSDAAATPEPSSLWLLGTGLTALFTTAKVKLARKR